MRVSEDATERKQTPVYSGFIKYFPLAIAAVARHSFVSNEQHNPGEPLHWARGKSTDETDALARHLVDMALGEASSDLDQQVVDATAIAWRAMANLQKLKEKQAVPVNPAVGLSEGEQQWREVLRAEAQAVAQADSEALERLGQIRTMNVHELMRELRTKDD